MDGIGNNTFASSSPFTPEAPAPSAPPPPSEVKVRTMRTDLASMAKSGGGLPRFENVKVSGLSAERMAKGDATPAMAISAEGQPAKRKAGLLIVFAVIAAAAAIGVLGYIGYRMFFSNGSGGEAPPSGTSAAPAAPSAPAPGSANNGAAGAAASSTGASATPFTHVSLFKKPADETLTLTLGTGASATSSASLQSFAQKLTVLLATASKTAAMLEIDVKDANGNAMSIADIFAQANEAILSPSLLDDNFNPDATFFVYRDAHGSWPGYVLSLQPGKNWLFLQSEVATLESSPAVANFFLNDPGAPSSDGFTDSLIASTTVRVLPFLDASVPSFFIYGWRNGDLILSTSQNGFAAAVARLGS